ncbi:hypothetical protein BDZ89DRAFT_563853 [Hymenopellis radicata]|nr:hypothetical protein BDZ89DRAFT_563853 [Hymenopellis radicata]
MPVDSPNQVIQLGGRARDQNSFIIFPNHNETSMASSTTVSQSAATTPFAPAPAMSPEDFILQYMKDTQVDSVHGKISRPANAFVIFKKYYKLSPTGGGAVWQTLAAEERAPFFDAQDAAKALHKEMYPDYEFKPHPKGEPQVQTSHETRRTLNASVMPVNHTAPFTFTARAPSVLAPVQPIHQDYHVHHYGYADEMSTAFDGVDLANDFFSSYDIAEVAPYLFECFETNVLADLNSELDLAMDAE